MAVPVGVALEADVVDRRDAGALAGQDDAVRRLEGRDPVVHRRDLAAHPDAEAIASRRVRRTRRRTASDVATPGSHRLEFAKSAMKANASSMGSVVSMRSCSLVMARSSSGPVIHPCPAHERTGVDLSSLIDDALEVTVVGSFSRVGFEVRRQVFGWTAPADGSLTGRDRARHRADVRPGSRGGRRVWRDWVPGSCSSDGARRSWRRVRDALVAAHGEDRFPIVVADMGSMASVRAAVATVLATESRLDILVDNAGAIYPERTIGPDGIEATLAIMAVNPFVLISGLLPLLEQSGGGRVITVTSGGMYTQAIDLDDLQWATGEYSGARAYARVKRMQVALVREWARRLRARDEQAGGPGVRVNAMHPGWADTPGLAEQLPAFYDLMRPILRSPAEGVDTIVWLATAPSAGARGGQVFLDRRPRPFDRLPSTRLSAADRARLWDIVVGLTGDPDPLADPTTG